MSTPAEDDDELQLYSADAVRECVREIPGNEVHAFAALSVFEEHGQQWCTCLKCGASWSVVEVETGKWETKPGAERIDEGDGWCKENYRYE